MIGMARIGAIRDESMDEDSDFLWNKLYNQWSKGCFAWITWIFAGKRMEQRHPKDFTFMNLLIYPTKSLVERHRSTNGVHMHKSTVSLMIRPPKWEIRGPTRSLQIHRRSLSWVDELVRFQGLECLQRLHIERLISAVNQLDSDEICTPAFPTYMYPVQVNKIY